MLLYYDNFNTFSIKIHSIVLCKKLVSVQFDLLICSFRYDRIVVVSSLKFEIVLSPICFIVGNSFPAYATHFDLFIQIFCIAPLQDVQPGALPAQLK